MRNLSIKKIIINLKNEQFIKYTNEFINYKIYNQFKEFVIYQFKFKSQNFNLKRQGIEHFNTRLLPPLLPSFFISSSSSLSPTAFCTTRVQLSVNKG